VHLVPTWAEDPNQGRVDTASAALVGKSVPGTPNLAALEHRDSNQVPIFRQLQVTWRLPLDIRLVRTGGPQPREST
jgi:hypothetical protein